MFQELLNECEGAKSIILGNGFGISFDIAMGQNNFNWRSLLDLCDILPSSQLYRVLSENKFDFELAHQKLNHAIDILNLYTPESPLIILLEEQIQYLRQQLIVAVGASHPPSFVQQRTQREREQLNQRVSNCRTFLSTFDKVFSLNYDLLLYWVRCYRHPNLGRDSFTRVGDDLAFIPNDNANFFFPHGSLFIYRDGISAIKSASSLDNPILARLEENIRNGRFPMCISEGTGLQKLKEIQKNSYLLYSYNKIKESTGSIFTFGCSFLDNKDSHIIEAMCRSQATRIVVGEFRPDEAARSRLVHEFARVQAELRTNKTIVIANSDGTQIW
ncbi:DUF4917 family protein [Plesiomonas shigelloides]|uniref:DUF4917 family protein n=1 Tax=Plesiomonas shigelloides TaxID=703 RepID=UPI0012622CE6|nr:DUF4917 family protein [Plesiomonas shigelloides]KAB7692462.1 DUF4917 family protein [Plesiomonas shigelloides]